jgi:hypothetical protein
LAGPSEEDETKLLNAWKAEQSSGG